MEKTYLLYSNNGTPKVVDIEDPSPVAEVIIIIICYLLGVSYNLIIIIAVLYHHKLRTSVYHLTLLGVCFTCFLDCLTNESIAFGFLLDQDTCWCGFSAGVFHFFLLTHSSSLCLLILERCLALKNQLVSLRVTLGGVLVTWTFGLIFLSPCMFGMIEVHYFPNRYACGAINKNIWFSTFSLLGFLLSWGFMGIGLFELICYIKKYLSDRKQRDILSIFPSSRNETQNSILPLTSYSENKTACTLLFLYIVLLLPMTTSFIVSIFVNPILEFNPWNDPRVPSNKIHLVMTNSLEPLFVFSIYMYNALVPIIILTSNRDIRLQSRQIFCSRINTVSTFDQSLISSKNAEENVTPANVCVCSLETPVLFATPRGLHLRIGIRNNQSSFRESGNSSKMNIRLMTSFCDLTINSTGLEQNSCNLKETVRLGEGTSRNRRCVRFSSQVDAFSAPESRLSSECST